MNTFEKELSRIFDQYDGLQNKKYVGRTCYGELGPDLRVKAWFISQTISRQYDALRMKILNRTDGEIDSLTLRFTDIWGTKKVNNPNFREGIRPHIWENDANISWYAYLPTEQDYAAIREAAASYLEVFRQPLPEIPKAPPKQKKSKAKEQAR